MSGSDDQNGVPDKFSDPTTIIPLKSLTDLIVQLHDVFAFDHICVEYVQRLLTVYTSNYDDWKDFSIWSDTKPYTRNLVDDGNGKFNLMVLCWNKGKGSPIHSHADSHCFMKILQGAAREEEFDWPLGMDQVDKEIDEAEGNKMIAKATHVHTENQCGYIHGKGLHRVQNNSQTEDLVTLHCYSPPFMECDVFDENGKRETGQMSFWSKFGKVEEN